MSNLIFRALLSGLRWESLIRILALHERVKGIGDGKVEGYRYTIVQRGDEILIILPDYTPKEKCQEVAKKILSQLAPKSRVQVVTMGYASSHCNFCLKSTPMSYHCRRCGGWYCESHRLPEKHDCPDGKGKAEKTVKPIKRKREKEREKVVVTEIPCG